MPCRCSSVPPHRGRLSQRPLYCQLIDNDLCCIVNRAADARIRSHGRALRDGRSRCSNDLHNVVFNLPASKSRRYRPEQEFRSDHYVRHNARRQEHLASLGLPVAGRTVLEVGAGVGDHSQYFLDRGCKLTVTEGRPENVEIIRKRFRGLPVYVLDMDAPEPVSGHPFEVTYCYGLLYHLKNPALAIQYLGQHTTGQLLLETCVSFDAGRESQSCRGTDRQSDSGGGWSRMPTFSPLDLHATQAGFSPRVRNKDSAKPRGVPRRLDPTRSARGT